MPRNFRIHGCILVLLLVTASVTRGQSASDWKRRIESAAAGQVIQLPDGEIALGDVTIPAGVHLRGAGYRKTIVNAASFRNGFIIRNSSGSEISDLAVRNARENAILLSHSDHVTLARLELRGNLTGLLIDRLAHGRVENLIIAKNRTGASLALCENTVLTNCTVADNTAIALTVSGARHVAIFNNLLVNSPTGVYVATNNEGLAVDHNLYFASFLGKFEGQATRTTLPGWQRLTGLDGHSLKMPVDFIDAARGDYRVVSVLPWAPNRATTAGWGVPNLAGFDAPARDILGNPSDGAIDLGAFKGSCAVNPAASRRPDGSFTVSSADGVKSAGLYDGRGVQKAVLFQNLPVPRGKHEFWLPSRDQWNRLLPAGQYEVRLVESQLNNPYLGLAGTFNRTSDPLDSCSWPEEQFAFDAQDRLYILQNAFENGMGIRALDAAYKAHRWMVPGGGGNIGAAVDDTWLYFLQWNSGARQHNLRKINLETGVIDPIAPGHANRFFDNWFSGETYGMAFLGGRLYVSDPVQGRIFHAAAMDPKFTQSFPVPGALSVTADVKTGLLWVINSEGKLLALDPTTGAVKASAAPSAGIKRISANNGRLATLSSVVGKVQVFDAVDPAHLKLLQTIGDGTGPFGPQKPDRFWFQEPSHDKMHVAINSNGDVAVVDAQRISFWGSDGSLKKQGLGFWGQHNSLGRFAGDKDVRIWGIDGRYSIKMDCARKRWTPDHYWRLPDFPYSERAPMNFFSTGGKNFGLSHVTLGDPGKTADHKLKTAAPIDPKQATQGILVVRFEERNAVPVSLYYFNSMKQTLVELHDGNKDGMIDGKDQAQVIRKADGNPVSFPGDRYGGLPWDESGDLVYAGGQIVKMTGLDPSKTWPVYDWAAPRAIPRSFDGKSLVMLSPYDYKTPENLGSSVQLARMSDGGYASSIGLRTSGGTGLANGAGTDIAGFGKDGMFRWIFRLNNLEGSEGVQSVPAHNLVMGMTTTHCDYMVMDNDGLGLGVLAMPKEAHWKGMWSDHAQQQQAWLGNDGQPYYILGDYAANGFHWFAITGMEKTKRQRVPVKLAAPTAAQLASEPGMKPVTAEKLPSPQVTIRRLAKPFTIDGRLDKWRAAGIVPVAIVTPETGSADIKGPRDCSAVIRLAYQGSDLYVQTIVFDDVVTFHQNVDRMYQQDGIEMAINGFMEGFKFNVALTADQGPVVFRNKFAVKADRLYTNEQVPRSIRVFDSAGDVEERGLIEAVYGVDLAQSKVIVTEFKLPLTPQVGLEGDPALIKTVRPGGTCWIGFYINDNDMPGGDVQKFLAWPATYGTFNQRESGARATFE
jgi:Periplasmic copper-binding protein (NosD)